MSAPSLIPELEDVIQHASPKRRADTLRRITAYFLDRASRFNDSHVQVFDDVFNRLIVEIETKARAELSSQLALVDNAPTLTVKRLARDDDIAVAGPVLKQSARLAETDLIEVAQTKSQAHLLAISERSGIAEPVTDVLVRRGDREVAYRVANNREARLSDESFFRLVGRAREDDELAEKVGLRPDIPARLLRDLLLEATEVVHQRLFASAKAETQAEIRRVLAKISHEVAAKVAPRDYSAAERTVETLLREGKLNEGALLSFAGNGRYEETVAALASLCAVPIEVVDRLMGGDRPDPILILCKSAGWGWPIAKAIIMARSGAGATSTQGLDTAFTNFERLSPTTAQRVMRFWQMRKTDDGGQTTHGTDF